MFNCCEEGNLEAMIQLHDVVLGLIILVLVL